MAAALAGVQVFVVAGWPFMEDITIEDLIVELNALRIRVAQLEAAQGAAADTNNGNVDDAVAFSRGDWHGDDRSLDTTALVCSQLGDFQINLRLRIYIYKAS